MRRITAYSGHLLLGAALLTSCGPSSAPGDASTVIDGAANPDSASPSDASPSTDAVVTSDASSSGDGAAQCTPAAGSATNSGYCDLFDLALFSSDSGPTTARLTGRLNFASLSPSCVVVDGVDVLSGAVGSAMIAHLDGAGAIPPDSAPHELARGAAVSDMTARCASDDAAQRFEVYGFIVRGRLDGGTFEAHCGRADNGTRWPPAVRVTCHHNVDFGARDGNAQVSNLSFMGMGFATTMFSVAVPHGEGGALTTVDGNVFVIPRRSPMDTGAPIASHNTTGWMGSVTEGSFATDPISQLTFSASTAEFDATLCPAPTMGMPGPGYVAPPAFLARVTGTNARGAYSTESFVNNCGTISMASPH